MAASSWQQAAQQDGVLHLPSPLRQRNTCKRAILAWEATHGTRLSACRKWLRRHPKRVLQGGGNIPNVAGVLIKYTRENNTLKRTFWNVETKTWGSGRSLGDVKIEPKPNSKASALLRVPAQYEKHVKSSCKSKTLTAGAEPAVHVLWVRHCFGCHNLKDISKLQEFSYRWFNYTSLCTTDDDHIQQLANSAQALKTQTETALGKDVQYKYYSSILPRAMMTAQLVKRSITSVDKTSDDKIRRMWYVSEKHNPFESLGFRWLRIILFPFLSLYYLMIPSQKQPGTQWFGDDGLNRLNLAASTKWAMKLNTLFEKEGISTQPPLGDSPGLLPAFLTYDAPSLTTWEKKVLPKLFDEEEKEDAKTVHLIVTHGKTLTAYLKKCGLTV